METFEKLFFWLPNNKKMWK